MPRVSLIVVTRDEERDLPGCLDSVPFADEVIVVDSGSTDRTVGIATTRGAKVFHNPWPGDGPQKAFALGHATGDWVLNLDADERLSGPLQQEIPPAIASGNADGYSLRYRTVFFGRALRFGGAGRERHLRLFRRERGRFEARPIHGGALVQGRVGVLRAPVVHEPYRSLEEYFDKFNRYTTQVARARRGEGARFSAASALRLPWGFASRYLFRLGFLDGYAGFAYASLSAFYDFVKYAKLHDIEPDGRGPPSP